MTMGTRRDHLQKYILGFLIIWILTKIFIEDLSAMIKNTNKTLYVYVRACMWLCTQCAVPEKTINAKKKRKNNKT